MVSGLLVVNIGSNEGDHHQVEEDLQGNQGDQELWVKSLNYTGDTPPQPLLTSLAQVFESFVKHLQAFPRWAEVFEQFLNRGEPCHVFSSTFVIVYYVLLGLT